MADMELRHEEDPKISQDEAADDEVRVGPFIRFVTFGLESMRGEIAGLQNL